MMVMDLIVFGLGRGFFDCNLAPALRRIAPNRLRATGYGILLARRLIERGAHFVQLNHEAL